MSARGIELVRLSALLHDTGKPECWARSKPWSDHVEIGRALLQPTFGDEVADAASKHHSSQYYDEEYHPSKLEEKVICVSDNIASASDRPDEPHGGTPLPRPPVVLSHALSAGSKSLYTTDAPELLQFSRSFSQRFQNGGSFEEVFDFLEKQLSRIPADTRPPNNDSSLWDHLRLTAAIANCVWRQGFRGYDRKRYSFTLISGDSDKVGLFLNKSSKLPDLRGRSELIKRAAERAALAAAQVMGGKECVIYSGGGGFLALTVPSMASQLKSEAERAFEEETRGRATMTVCSTDVDGLEMGRFGDVWAEAMKRLRDEKLEGKGGKRLEFIEEGKPLCDVCGEAVGSHPSGLLPLDASPRPEMLCDSCAEIREGGRTGRSLQEIDESSVALIRLDGDRVGSILDGTALKVVGKSQTPGRLATLSRLIHAACEKDVTDAVEKAGGLTIFAGGDDALAFTPGPTGLRTALAMSKTFSERFSGSVTTSASVVIADPKHPIYYLLEAASAQLRRAKEEGRGRVAFSFMVGAVERRSRFAYTWKDFEALLRFAEHVMAGMKASQVRPISQLSTKDPFECEAMIKYQMGRGAIPWDTGVELLDYNRRGMLGDAFIIYSQLRKREAAVLE